MTLRSGPNGEPAEVELEYSREEVHIRDARPDLLDGSVGLERTGSILVPHRTALSTADFYGDGARIRESYYKEICQLVKEATGAETVVAIEHQVRNQARALEACGGDLGKLPKYKMHSPEAPTVDAYFVNAHADYSDKTAARTAREELHRIAPGESRRAHALGRFMMVNAWRSISDSGPIRNHHLAVLDGSTLALDDIVLVDMFYDTFATECVQVAHTARPRHRWLYFPEMQKDEVLLFKQYDSDRRRPARWAVHCAFEDPTAPAAAPPRESIEVRTICFFPGDREGGVPGEGGLLSPWNFPAVDEVAGRLLHQLDFPELWPEDMRQWLRVELARNATAAAAQVLALMIDWNADPENSEGLIAGASAELRSEVSHRLRALGFEARLRQNFAAGAHTSAGVAASAAEGAARV